MTVQDHIFFHMGPADAHPLSMEGRLLPRGLVLMSPWTDLTSSGESFLEKAELDPVLNREYIDRMVNAYCPCKDRKDPFVSRQPSWETSEKHATFPDTHPFLPTHWLLPAPDGGYSTGSSLYARTLTSKLAAATSMDVLCFDYSLAPEHPYPAALEDALRAWDYLMLGEIIGSVRSRPPAEACTILSI